MAWGSGCGEVGLGDEGVLGVGVAAVVIVLPVSVSVRLMDQSEAVAHSDAHVLSHRHGQADNLAG